jgi:flagellar M-ring protein FliF
MWEQIERLVKSLTRTQQIGIVAAALAVAGGLYLLRQNHREKDFRPLFTGLAAEDANQVLGTLKGAQVEYRLTDNGATVLVPSAKLAEMRLLVAGSGLPKTGRIGYELFDRTTFGVTDFAEQVNFRRALEGELERSVTSLSEVEHARVHLTLPKESVFTERRQPAKASVLLSLRRGAELSPRNVKAIEHLVANAVEGLAPESVAVVDMQGNLLKKVSGEDERKDTPLEYRQKIERDLLAKVESTLEPVLGTDHFRAGVSVDVDFSSGEQSEETFDPNRSVMVQQQRSEETAGAGPPSGIPGTPSNLPRPTTRPGSGNGSNTVRRTEDTTYQTSRMIRKTTLPEGTLRRISASAVLDQQVRWEGVGAKARRIVEPPSPETIEKVRELIAGAIGFNEQRGDRITVQTLPFESTLRNAKPPADPAAPKPAAPAATRSPIESWLADKGIHMNPLYLAAGAAAIVIVLMMGLVFVLRRKKTVSKRKGGKVDLDPTPSLPAGAAADHSDGKQVQVADSAHLSPAASRAAHPEGEPVSGASLANLTPPRQQTDQEVLNSLQLPQLNTKKAEVLVRHLSEQAKHSPDVTAQLLRSWLNEKEAP